MRRQLARQFGLVRTEGVKVSEVARAQTLVAAVGDKVTKIDVAELSKLA